MTTEIAPRAEVPAPTPEYAKSLSQPALQEHRTRIGLEVKAVLSAYFQPQEEPETRAMQLAWWCDELQDWTHEQVVWGLRAWNRDNPRTRPTPGDIVRLLKLTRGKRVVARLQQQKQPGPPKETVTPEQMAEIRAEVARAADKMTGVTND